MRVLPVIALFFCCVIVGCQTTSSDSTALTASENAALPTEDCWPFRPKKIIVHPMSYFPMRAQDKTPMVDIYIECLDLDDQTTRSVGVLRLNVEDPKSNTSTSFKCDLGDKSVNIHRWDSVSRCYLIELPLPAGFSCETNAFLKVSATLNLDPDELLTTQSTVHCPQHKP
ncbi:MAG: hypothetical protein WCP80_01690 [Phycisphaerales bacterium]